MNNNQNSDNGSGGDIFDIFDEQAAAAIHDIEIICPDDMDSPVFQEDFRRRVSGAVSQLPAHNGRGEFPLYLDFETVPDDDRLELFGLPEVKQLPPETPVEGMFSIPDLLGLSIEKIEFELSNLNPVSEYLIALGNSENQAKKPRAGVQKAIDKVFAMRAVAEQAIPAQRKEMATHHAMCKIVSAAWAVGLEEVQCQVVGEWSDRNERDILEYLWELIRDCRPVVTWNGRSFDLRVLFMRSILLGVQPTRILNIGKYSSKDSLDLQDVFNDYQIPPKGRGMKWAARILGIEIPAGDCDGSQVEAMWNNGDPARHEELARYNMSDVVVLREIHRKLTGTFVVA